MDAISLLVLGLAAWRITSLLVDEDGPWEILGRFRCLVGLKWDDHSRPCPSNEFAKLLSCVWCTSVWTGLVLSLLYFLWPTSTFWVALPFALSALAILISKLVGGRPD